MDDAPSRQDRAVDPQDSGGGNPPGGGNAGVATGQAISGEPTQASSTTSQTGPPYTNPVGQTNAAPSSSSTTTAQFVPPGPVSRLPSTSTSDSSSVSQTAAPTSSNVITFSDLDRIYANTHSPITFTWTAQSNIVVQDIKWITNFYDNPSNCSLNSEGAPPAPTDASLCNPTELFQNTNFTTSTTLLNMTSSWLVNHYTSDMALWLDWVDKDSQVFGHTFTPLFTVFNASDPSPPPISQIATGFAQNGGQEVSTSLSSTAQASATSQASNPTSSAQSAARSHLSHGAIAGIVVGAVVVIALAICGIVLCVLRRRRGAASGGPYRSEPASDAFIGDKMRTHVQDSPHDPYSDDGAAHRRQGDSLEDSEYDQAPAHTHESDNRASYHSAAGHTQDVNGSRQGVSTSVAHLVEEGMTEDDIRRLEEEERHLDAEIQRAGQR